MQIEHIEHKRYMPTTNTPDKTNIVKLFVWSAGFKWVCLNAASVCITYNFVLDERKTPK